MKWMFLISVLVVTLPAGAGGVQLSDEQRLGQRLYLDTNLSINRNQSCATCHTLEPVAGGPQVPGAGKAPPFADPVNVAAGTAVSTGSQPGRSGRLNAPSAGYAAFSPHFHWNAEDGLYVGGQFWNGRAATLAEQAMRPPLNPDEMAMPSRWAVVTRLREDPAYRDAFATLYGVDLARIPPAPAESTGAAAPAGVNEAYERMAQAIAAFEKSRVLNRFTAKYDFFLAGAIDLSAQERRGLEVFNDKGKCSACHISEPGTAPDGGVLPPLFTDFTYDNLGLPRNVNIPGDPDPDPGLGGRADVAARDPSGAELGKHKVMGLRNIALTPPYGHNGVFATLEQITHFYNTRDTKKRVCRDNNDAGFGTSCWPPAEVPSNVNVEELGNLELTDDEEAALVAFMLTLSDGYPEWGGDPLVPPGTPSPFAATALPPFP